VVCSRESKLTHPRDSTHHLSVRPPRPLWEYRETPRSGISSFILWIMALTGTALSLSQLYECYGRMTGRAGWAEAHICVAHQNQTASSALFLFGFGFALLAPAFGVYARDRAVSSVQLLRVPPLVGTRCRSWRVLSLCCAALPLCLPPLALPPGL
jgi:hypothetical protein